MNFVAEILDLAIKKKIMIACAESCTGGMLTAALTDLPGSSAIMDRGFLTYTNAAKVEMLGVKEPTLAAHGAVSEEVACEMAQGALSRSAASLALSITGIAGPGGSEHKPEGRVCFGVATQTGVQAETQEFGALGRGEVREKARDHALRLIMAELQRMPLI